MHICVQAEIFFKLGFERGHAFLTRRLLEVQQPIYVTKLCDVQVITPHVLLRLEI